MMHNWQENEIKELLTIRASEGIRHQITGTVKDSAVYSRMTKLLAERGVYRTHMQVISKLKALRKQYSKYHQQKIRCGTDYVEWPFYEQCHRAFGNTSLSNPVKRQRSPSPPSAPLLPPPPLPPPSPPPPVICEKPEEVVVSLWDEVEETEMSKRLDPVEPEDDEEEEDYSPSEHIESVTVNHQADRHWRRRTDQSVHKVPTKRKKTSMMDRVTTLVSNTVDQLREMDAAMQAQEDARLERLMEHEKEMQNSLMSQLVAMHERINRENHERHLELVDMILSRIPSSSSSSGP